ncbi:MAG: ComF family protein [Bacteroidales bacterium]|nr:ComF family protein [Bacteroidales bacterium]
MKTNKLLDNVLSMYYPRLCVGCGNALQQNEELLCLHCLLHLPETNYFREHDNPLKLIFAGRVKVEEVSSLLFYKKGNSVQNMLHALKYKGKKELGSFLGSYYGEKLIQEPRYQQIDYIIPIPLHPKKQQKRGYNQSEWIAIGLSQGMNVPYTNEVLLRTTFTETQTKKSRFNRWENVKEVFAVQNADVFAGKHLLVCDDVLTTGATMEAAIQQLLTIEGVKISVVTLATAHN